MSSSCVTITTPLENHGSGSRVGPVFCMKDQCAFVKVSHADDKRAVINTSNMTLVDYAERHEYPEGALRSDQSLFVPIFCKECYGTNEDDYTEALAGIVSCESDTFLVGMCSVFGVARGEVYPESRKEFVVGNDMAYSGACHLQPGKAVFLHKIKKDIGRVKCYWHVHSRSVDKTFLYCCVACDNNEYAKGVVVKPEMSMGFSLGTVGDNESGPITEECSLVSVPMRPGCFCTLVSGKDLAQTMTRMGFSTLKDTTLDAGIVDAMAEEEEKSSGATDDVQADVESPSADMSSHESSDTSRSIMETVKSLRKAVLDQAAEVRVLKDVLEAVKVQNSVLTQRLKCPDDPDTLFTLQGAKEFTRRTGVKTKLCAGVKPTQADTNTGVPDPVPDPSGATLAYKSEQRKDTMAITESQIDNLIKLLQQPQPLPQQQQPQQQQPLPLPLTQQQQYQQSQAQLQTLQNFLQLAPILQQFAQPQSRHLWNPQQQQQQTRQGFFGGQDVYNPSNASNPGDTWFQYGTLTEEQRRKIAMEYNKEESDRQAASQKEQERMLESIKASIRDVILEQQHSSVSQESSSNRSNMDTLQSLARDTPYKRMRKQDKDDDPDHGDVFCKVMNELRELTKQISKCSSSSSSSGGGDSSDQAVAMDTEDAGRPITIAPSTSNSQQSQPSTQQSETTLTKKQQAGYMVPSGGHSSLKTSASVADFISAVVTKM